MKPGGVPFWVEVVCCRCNDTIAGRFVVDLIPRKALREDAKAAGWTLKPTKYRNKDWFCKACSQTGAGQDD